MSAKLWLPKHSEMHEKDKNIDEIIFWKVYYNFGDKGLLQIATDHFITNWDNGLL